MTAPPLLPSQWRACWTCGAWASSPAEAPCLGCGGPAWERMGWSPDAPMAVPPERDLNSVREACQSLGLLPIPPERWRSAEDDHAA